MSRVGPLLIGDRPLPHRPEAERGVLSCALQNPKEHLEDVLAWLTDDAFYVPAHRKLLSELRGILAWLPVDALDMVTITEMLTDSLDELGGEKWLMELYELVPTTAKIEAYVKLVLQAKSIRDLIRAGSELVGNCYEFVGDPGVLAEEHMEAVNKAVNISIEDEAVSVKEGVAGLRKTITEAAKTGEIGLPTGFPSLDYKLNGMRKGSVYVIAGRTSLGKTSLASNIAEYVADRKETPVLLFSLEMTVEELTLRMIQSHIREHVDEKQPPMAYDQGSDYVQNLPIYIDATKRLTSANITRRATRMKRKHGIGLVVIDYLQRLRTMAHLVKSRREQQVAWDSAEFKTMAGELGVPVLLLCQLNRKAEETGRPRLSHLRESGAIEQDADVVILLYKKPSKEADEAADRGKGRETAAIIAKQRNGPTGTVMLQFFKHFTRFDSIHRIKDDDLPKEEPAGPAEETDDIPF